MEYCGIDLHSNKGVVSISNDEDRILYQKRLPNDLGQIRAALESHQNTLAGVVVESTYDWYWLVDGLIDAGYRVHLAHPAAIKKYDGLKHSGDFANAAYLAQLLRLGLLAEGYVYPREELGARDLARKRMQLVRYRKAQILSIEGILMRQTGGRMKDEAVKRLTAQQVDEMGFAPDVTHGSGRVHVLNRLKLEDRACECYGVVIDEIERLIAYKLPIRLRPVSWGLMRTWLSTI